MSQKFCKLCFKTKCEDFQTIGDIKHVDKLLLKMNLNTSKEILICYECAHKLQVYVHFKIACVDMKNRMLPNTIFINDVSLDVADVENKNRLNSEMQICCFCKETAERKCLTALNETKENVFIVNMLKEHMDLNLNNGEEILSCKYCLNTLQGLFEFVTNCLDAKEERSKYVEVGTNAVEKVELKSVEQLTSKLTNKYESESCAMNEMKQYDNIRERIFVKEESIVKHEEHADKRESNIKTEYVGIKSEQSDYNSLLEPKDDNKKNLRQCEKCAFSTDCEMDLKRHLSTHAGPSVLTTFKCEICPYVTKYKWDFDDHVQSHKKFSETVAYKCKMCTFETHCRSSYNSRKLANEDSMATFFKCEMCSYETHLKTHFKKHIILNHHNHVSGEKVFKCLKCQRDFCLKSQLKKHIMLRHVDISSETKMFQCEICSFETERESDIKAHMLIHTATLKNPKQEVHRCEECTFETIYEYQLNRHMLSHTVKTSSHLTPYKCDKCNFQTGRKIYLNQHKFDHMSPSEMFECSMCSHKLKRRSDLERHIMSTHTSGNTSYQCDKCSYKSKYIGYFKKHVLTHVDPLEGKDI